MRRRFAVLEEDKTAVFRHGDARPQWGGRGNLLFIGMEGSGRRKMAREAASMLGLEYAEADSPQTLERLLHGEARSIAVLFRELSDPALVSSIRNSSKTFYLMRQASDLAREQGDPSRTPVLAAAAESLEPSFMAAAHFILPLYATRDEWLADVAEKARL
jgi:hypothetical protein